MSGAAGRPPLNFGLVGCGGIGRLRAEAVRRAGHRLVAVCDLDAERAARLARGHDAATAAGWSALLERPDVDAVLVCTPPSSHEEISVAALESGRHVLCEKPLARSAEEGRRMVRAAGEAGRALATGFNFRFFPSVRRARAYVEEGRIGPLDHVRSYAGYSAEEHTEAWLHDAAVTGGGALRDNGIHLIDTTAWLVGEPLRADGGHAWSRVWDWPGCEDNGLLLLRTASGAPISLHASWTEWRGYRFRIELYGRRGCLHLTCFPMVTDLRWRDASGTTRRRVHRFPLTHAMERLRSYRWTVTRSLAEEIAHFARAAAGSGSAGASGEDGLRALELAEAAGSGTPMPAPAHR